MDRWYRFEIKVSGVARARCGAVASAAEAVWPVDEWRKSCPPGSEGADDRFTLAGAGDGQLAEGEAVEARAERLTQAIWAAHGDFCAVSVATRCLDPHPIEQHLFDAAAYARRAPVAASAAD
jgi:hypothetical protein